MVTLLTDFFSSELCGYVGSLLGVEGDIFNVMPIAKLLGMPEDSKNDLTSSQRDENEQLKIILQHWSNKNNVVEDLSALREALESLKQEGNLSRHFPLFFFLSSLVFFLAAKPPGFAAD